MEKVEYYNQKAMIYEKRDVETEIRYQRAINLAQIFTGARILDIGCKYAYLRKLLRKEEIQVEYYGLDISEEVLKEIDGYDPDHFKVGDVCLGIPFPDNYFDYVFALEVMEHVESPTTMVKEVRRVLKDKGSLVVSVPNPYCLLEIYLNIMRRPDTEGHISSFTHQTVSRLMEFAEMCVIDYCGTTPGIPFLRRVAKRFPRKSRFIFRKTNNIFLSRSFIYKVVFNTNHKSDFPSTKLFV